MELRHLRYFLAVAEELNFTKASEKLNISQPPLSRQIKELERELDAVLFERNNKRVALTDAGRYFEQEVRKLLFSLETVSITTRKIAGNTSGDFKIGYVSSVFSPAFSALVQYLKAQYIYVTFKLFEIPTARQTISLIEQGELDLGIYRATLNSVLVKSELWFRDGFSVISKKGAYKLETESDIEKLNNATFIFFNKAYAPYYYDALMEICVSYGFKPNVIHESNDFGSIMQLVSHGLGVSIVPSSLLKNQTNFELDSCELKNQGAFTEVRIAVRKNDDSELTRSAKSFLIP